MHAASWPVRALKLLDDLLMYPDGVVRVLRQRRINGFKYLWAAFAASDRPAERESLYWGNILLLQPRSIQRTQATTRVAALKCSSLVGGSDRIWTAKRWIGKQRGKVKYKGRAD
jgi:hypothetical protein